MINRKAWCIRHYAFLNVAKRCLPVKVLLETDKMYRMCTYNLLKNIPLILNECAESMRIRLRQMINELSLLSKGCLLVYGRCMYCTTSTEISAQKCKKTLLFSFLMYMKMITLKENCFHHIENSIKYNGVF